MLLSDATLGKLLLRGERARVSGSTRGIRESFENSASPYWDLPLLRRDELHVRLRAAESAGAVTLEWSRQGGDDRTLDAVRLVSVDCLARFLKRSTQAEQVAKADAILGSFASAYPRVRELLGAWARLNAPRGLGPESAKDIADAIRVLEAMANSAEDVIVRVLSVALFKDSKRIEALIRHLDVLTAESLTTPAREWHEVLSSIGLVKEPQPLLCAGDGFVTVRGDLRVRLVPPYLGLANGSVDAYEGSPTWVLTIENLTSFHLAARELNGCPHGLIVYTGGMPSPSWCAAYVRLLDGLDAGIPAYHWGDIDLGGFRIAARIRECLPPSRRFFPWLMDSESLDVPQLKVSKVLRDRMANSARRAGWGELAERMAALSCEQEGVPVSLP